MKRKQQTTNKRVFIFVLIKGNPDFESGFKESKCAFL